MSTVAILMTQRLMLPERADGLREATWMASFRSRASIRRNPAR